jgi:hypothetical protein
MNTLQSVELKEFNRDVPNKDCFHRPDKIANCSGGTTMTRIPSWLIVITAVALVVLGGRAISAQDKYTVQVPNGTRVL